MCILLVEDEELIREIMTECLRDAGFEVMEASSGQQAAELFEQRPDHFTLLVTDFNMPGRMDGAALAERLRLTAPHLPVVIVSGRPEVLQSSWRSSLNYALLPKPYRPHELVDLARTMLG